MGIWNTPRRSCRRWTNRPHYPSWGFGTSSSPNDARNASSAHYPSWGFGTRLAAGERPQLVSSLPLMGIWNGPLPRYGSFRSKAHYPSWGFGTSELRHWSVSSSGPHYPSWGFGTCAGSCGRQASPELITPHGDLERAAAAALRATFHSSLPLMGIWNSRVVRTRTRVRRAHYPSWGFGTPPRRPVRRPPRCSLPLMGIWNLAAVRTDAPPEPRSSLPLMGIWNDRAASRQTRNRLTSLPLMGIWNANQPCPSGKS